MGTVVVAPAEVQFAPQRTRQAGVLASWKGRKKWRPDERVDSFIREAYRRLIQENDRKATKWAREMTGWPKFMISRRAAELGLARVKEPGWSLAEVAILEENAHFGLPVIRQRLVATGFHRTQTAILIKRKRLELTRSGDGYSATALSKLFGIDQHAVTKWIERGILAAERCGTQRTARQGGDTWFIQLAAVREFLFAHPDEWDLRKVEKWWFLDLITDGKITR